MCRWALSGFGLAEKSVLSFLLVSIGLDLLNCKKVHGWTGLDWWNQNQLRICVCVCIGPVTKNVLVVVCDW